MKNFFKIFFIVILVLFLIILTIPLAFKGELMEIAKKEVNKNVRAEVNWTDFRVSLFRGFPDLRVSMEDMSVRGEEEFSSDTLISFRRFSAEVDLISAISGKVKVKSIILDHPVVRAIALDDSTVNWDISYESEEEPELEEPDTSEMAFEISLKEFRINDAQISYFDAVSSTFAGIEGLNFLLSGNMSQDYSDLDVSSSAESVTVEYNGIKYLNEVYFGLDALIGADMENMEFEISENELKINEITLSLEGFFGLTQEDDIDLDIRFNANETSFKSLLSMIPAVYLEDFDDINTSGTLELNGTAKGKITENTLPDVSLNLLVNNGYLAYPELPESVKNINIDLNVFYDGVAEDNTRIDLDVFHMEIAGNPVDLKLSVRTPVTDMQLNGKLETRMDFASLNQALPLEDMDLNGILTADIQMIGKMSDIENENYEDFRADGSLELINFLVEGQDLPVPVNIDTMRMIFSPQYVNLSTFRGSAGKSDIHMEGNLENFIPYVFKDEIISGRLSFNSGLLDLNQIMAAEEQEESVDEDTSQLSVIKIPENIHFELNTSIDQLIYDELEIENLRGKVIIKDGILDLETLTMDLLNGSMSLGGEYNTTDINTPVIELTMDMNEIDIQSSFYAFNTVRQLAPIAEMARGDVSVHFDFVSFLDSTMNPVMNSIVGSGRLETDAVKLENSETFNKIGNLLNISNLEERQFKNLDLSFNIREGRVYVEPFDVQLGDNEVNIAGSQGLDQTLDYDLQFRLPREQFGNTANDLLEDLASQARSRGFDINPGDMINVTVQVAGTFSDPEVSLGAGEIVSSARKQVKEAVEERIQQEVDKVREDVNETVNEEIDKILEDASNEAEKIKKAAEEAGEKLIGEAELRKKQLVQEAGSNPLKRIAAEKTGDGLINAAEKQAERLKEEAAKQADQVLEKAKVKADELRRE